jgi:hypothetical protein
MMPEPADYPAPQPHGPVEALFDEDVYWVQGTMRMGPGMRISRTMAVLRQGGELALVNPVRLDSEGEAALEALGAVKHVVRLGAFHGLDDRYTVDRYGAEFWCQAGSDHYPEPKPTQVLSEGAALPIEGAELFVFRQTKLPECAILLRRHGGLLITCDGVQHYGDWSRCSPLARLVMRFMGFRNTVMIGPLWLKVMTDKGGSLRPDFERLLELDFDHHISAHGDLRRGGARELLRAAVARAFPG